MPPRPNHSRTRLRSSWLSLSLVSLATTGFARQDCNDNGIPDAIDILSGTSQDCNQNGVPDECEFGHVFLYQDLDAAPVWPAGVSATATGLWHVTQACRPAGGGAAARYVYFGIDAQCNYDTGGPVVGFYVLHDVPLPEDSAITLQYWSYYEGEHGGGFNCDPTVYFDHALVWIDGVLVDELCAPPFTPPAWDYRTIDVTPFAGQVVDIAWEFDTIDGFANNAFGWGIDDLRITTFEDHSGNGVPDACERISVTYCQSNPNSSGAAAGLAALGSPLVRDEDLFLRTVGAPPHELGYYLMSMAPASTPLPPPSQGNLCLGAAIVRINVLPGHILNSGSVGELELRLDFQALPQQTVFLPGETWRFQCWFRDGAASNTSHGVAVQFH